jgi:predicted transcriptional regulator
MSNVVTARISDDTLALVDSLAESRERSRAWVLAKLIDAAARKQIEMDDFIQVGLNDIEAGRTIPHEEVVAQMMERRARREAA